VSDLRQTFLFFKGIFEGLGFNEAKKQWGKRKISTQTTLDWNIYINGHTMTSLIIATKKLQKKHQPNMNGKVLGELDQRKKKKRW